jgi:hypothetical protein
MSSCDRARVLSSFVTKAASSFGRLAATLVPRHFRPPRRARNPMKKTVPANAPMRALTGRTLLALAASAAILAGCGGGGGSEAPTTTTLSQTDARAAAANGLQGGDQGVSSIDSVFDTAQVLVGANAAAMVATARAASASAQDAGSVSATVGCAGGGTATLTISGGTLLTQLNGQFDAGEHYTLAFTQCSGPLGLVHLDGQLEMDIVSVSGDAPVVTTAALTMTGLTATAGNASVTLNGQATLVRSVTTNGLSSTATSEVTSPSFSMATSWNGRSGSFTVTNLDVTRTAQYLSGLPTGSTIAGHHELHGTADGQAVDLVVSTTGEVAYDATGNPISGTWTTVRPDATITTTIANGQATITVDDGNDGTIDSTWTIPVATLMASAG